jgi:hypothetical protein
MKDKLELAVETIYSALTTVWENNGNIMADAVRDNVLTNLSEITSKSIEEVESKISSLIEDAQ